MGDFRYPVIWWDSERYLDVFGDSGCLFLTDPCKDILIRYARISWNIPLISQKISHHDILQSYPLYIHIYPRFSYLNIPQISNHNSKIDMPNISWNILTYPGDILKRSPQVLFVISHQMSRKGIPWYPLISLFIQMIFLENLPLISEGLFSKLQPSYLIDTPRYHKIFYHFHLPCPVDLPQQLA